MRDFDNDTLNRIPEIKSNLESNIENFRFREALKDAMEVARLVTIPCRNRTMEICQY